MSIKYFFLALLSLVTIPVAADPAAVSALTERLQGYDTYEADFRQTVTDGQGHVVQESKGHLRAKRNGLFHWHVEPPLEQFIAADGEEVQVYDPDLRQVTIYPMNDRLTATPALLLSGDVTGLADAYAVTRVDTSDNNAEFRLEPKNPDSLFVSLTLVFDDKALQEMRLHDSLDQHSTLSFSDIAINQGIPDDVFQLDYPASVDVIRNQANP